MYTAQPLYLFWPDYAAKHLLGLEEMFHHVG